MPDASHKPPPTIGLGLNLPQDADISHFSLRSEQSAPPPIPIPIPVPIVKGPPPPWAVRFQATVDDDSDAEIASPVSPKDTARRYPYRAADDSTPASPTSPTSPQTPHSHSHNKTSASPSYSHHNARKPYPPGTYAVPNTTLTPPSSAESSPKQRPTVHFSTRPPVILHHRSNSLASETDASPPRYGGSPKSAGEPRVSVDRQWGQLFTQYGEPTRRLGSILRGLANYMIREYEPRYSLVVTPAKMYAFYRKYKLDKEQFPFQGIFDYQSRHCLRNLELLYQDLSCEYHLIQDHHHSTRPYIPALTPTGFQTWLTTFIQSSPDHEAQRLQTILADVPVEADSPAHEPLPTHLPRYLLPVHRNDRTYKDIVCALDDWNKRMGSTSEPTSPSWSNLLYEAFRGTSQVSTGRREKYTDEHKRHSRRPSEDVTVSPASTSARRQRNRDTRPPQPVNYVSTRDREPDREPEPRYFPSSKSEPARRYSEPSPERIKHGYTSRRRDRSPKSVRAESIDTARRHKHSTRRDSASYSRGRGDSKGTPDASPARADSYRFFQGRAAGPTYDEFLREKVRV